MEKKPAQTDLADRTMSLLLVGIPLLTAIIELISKVVNYGRPVRELRI